MTKFVSKGEGIMLQLGNLAVVCARKEHVDLRICDGEVVVHIGFGEGHPVLRARWDDNSKIMEIIHRLNYGKGGRGRAW